MKNYSDFRPLLKFVAWLGVLCIASGSPALSQVDDSDSSVEQEENTELGPVPKIDLGDKSLNDDLDRFHEYLSNREFSRARSIIKRLKTKLRKPDPPIASVLDRCSMEAEAGVVLEKAKKYFDKERMKQALAVIMKEDPDGTTFVGSLTGEELSELRKKAFEEVYLVLADYEKESASPEEQPEEEQGRGGRGWQQTGRSKVIGGSREDGDVRTGKFALHWQTGDQISWITIGSEVFQKMIDEGQSMTDYRYLNLSIRCEDPKARPQLLVLFDANGGQVNAPRGGGRRGGTRAFQRDGYNSAMIPQGRWQDLRLDLKKFTRKGEVEWDMIETLRIVYTGGPDSLIMIDDVRLEKP